VSNADTSTVSRAEAGARGERIRAAVRDAREDVLTLVGVALVSGVSIAEIVAALTISQRVFGREHSDESAQGFRPGLFDPIIDCLLDPASEIPRPDRGVVAPGADDARAAPISTLAGLGGRGR